MRSKQINILLQSLGIDEDSFLVFIEWALSEQLVFVLAKASEDTVQFTKPDTLKQFRSLLHTRTGRRWSSTDLDLLFTAVQKRLTRHFREPISYGDYLKLLWNSPHVCKQCGKTPPNVKLHIDHIIPVSLGGSSKKENIQFLCAECNLKKSNKKQGDRPWLHLD